MRQDALHRISRRRHRHGRGDHCGPCRHGAVHSAVKAMPAVAGVGLRDMILRNFRETMAETMNQIFFNVLFSAVIAFGVVYNSRTCVTVGAESRARESARARLHACGDFVDSAWRACRADPGGTSVGAVIGVRTRTTHHERIPTTRCIGCRSWSHPSTIAWAFLVVIAAAGLSGLIVRRRLDQLDLVAVLKRR